MRKLIPLLSVAVAVGVGVVGYRLWRTGEQLSQAVSGADVGMSTRDSSSPPARTAAVTDVGSAEVTRSDATSVAATGGSPLPGEEVPDQFGPDGHDAGGPPLQADQDAGGAPATPSSDPYETVTAEAAALAEARSTLEALLTDPDPAVRAQAAELLEVVASGLQ